MKQRMQLFLGIFFFVVLPDAALADMMERTTTGDMIFFIVEVFLVFAVVVSIVVWIITSLIGRIQKVNHFFGYTTLVLGGALCIVILLGKIYYHSLGYGAYKKLRNKIIHTQSLFKQIELSCELYAVEHGQYPTTEEQVINAFRKHDHSSNNENIQQNVLLDGWGIPIKWTLKGENISLRSAGPDRKFNNKDDLTNTNK